MEILTPNIMEILVISVLYDKVMGFKIRAILGTYDDLLTLTHSSEALK